jgi:hypothetical protein
MRRLAILTTFLILFTLLLAACSDEDPSEVAGCKVNSDDPQATIYTRDGGCLYGDNLKEAHGEGEHAEGESEGESGESEEQPAEEGSSENTEAGSEGSH